MLTFCGQWSRVVPRLTLQFCLHGSLPTSMLEQWCWWKHGSRVVLNVEFVTLCASSLYVWLQAWLWAQGSGSCLGRVSLDFLLLGWCTAGLSCQTKCGVGTVFPPQERGCHFIACLEERKKRLAWAQPQIWASPAKVRQSSGLEIALIPMGPSGSWCTRELHLTLRAETKVIYTFPPSSTFSIWTVIFWVIFGEGMPLLTAQSLGIIFITNSV